MKGWPASLLIAFVVALPASALAHPTSSVQLGADAQIGPESEVAPAHSTSAASQEAIDPREQMAKEIHEIWAGRTLRRGTTAVYVVDAHTGAVLYAVHEDEPLNPASNVKLISTATVLDTLGPEWRYATRLFGPVPDAEGVIHGDLYLVGSFDPTFSPAHLRRLAERLADSGVTRVRGGVLLGQQRRDAVSRSRIEIRVTGSTPGEAPEVSISPELSFVDLEVTAVTTRRGRPRLRLRTERVQVPGTASDAATGPAPAWIDGGQAKPTAAKDRLQVKLSGRIRAGQSRTYRRSVPQRAQLTTELLRAALIEVGVTVEGGTGLRSLQDYVRTAVHSDTPYLPVELARHQSAPIRELVTRVNKRSINWLADSLIKTAGAVTYGGTPDLDKGVQAMETWLERAVGISSADVTLDTGSGLSYKTALTVEHIVRVLRTAGGFTTGASPAWLPRAEVFRSSLAVAGRDGTLRRRFRKSEVRGKLIGKTGTLTGIIALAGVLSLDEGNALCFAIVTNQHRRGYRWRVRREHEAMVKAMYRYLEHRTAADAAGQKLRPEGDGSATQEVARASKPQE